MRLRDLQIGTYSREQPWRLEINKDSCCVSCHYLSKLSRLDTGDVCKAYIKLSDLVPKGGRRAISALGVCEIESKLDFDQYFTLSPPSKKRMLLEHLHGGLLQIAEELRWPKEPFENAYQAVLADNILYSEFWKTPKWNRSRTLRGQVHFCFDIDRLEFNAVAFNKAGREIARKHLVTYPRAIDSDHYDTLNKYGWKDDRTFFLEGRPTWHHWEVTLP